MRGIPVISIAEAVGDPRLVRTKCHICESSFFCCSRGRRRFICKSCEPKWERMQSRASQAVQLAIKRGELVSPKKLSCADCGKPSTGYDHRNYALPLEVAPVCNSCNYWRGPAKWKVA